MRKRQNTIRGLIDNEGNWVTGLKGMKDIICTYYADLFSSLCPSHTQVAAAVQNLNLRVSVC